MPVNKEVTGIIKEMSRRKYGRDVNVVANDIRTRAQLDRKEEQAQNPAPGFPPIF